MCFTPRCLDCFLFLHAAAAATKLRIPIGRHRNARQQQQKQRQAQQQLRDLSFRTGVRLGKKEEAVVRSGAQCNRRQQPQMQETSQPLLFLCC